jgi:hypothetical protein
MGILLMTPVNPSRPRSISNVVSTRTDGMVVDHGTPRRSWWRRPRRSTRPTTSSAAERWKLVGAVVTWTILGLLVAALWASLLFGDSLSVPPA